MNDSSSSAMQRLEDELALLEKAHLRREIRSIESASATSVVFHGKKLLMLASNNYLNLTVHPSVKEAAQNAISKFGSGSGGARLTTGGSVLHEELEKQFARFKKTESALLFNTGYMANTGTLSALCGPEDFIFSDALNHASIIDGCKLSRAKTIVYQHIDWRDLEEKIKNSGAKRGLIVSDAVFSMDGDLAPLLELSRLARRYGLLLMLDEAHALGVLGKTGRGIEEHFGTENLVDISVCTLSKALASEGGCVCGSKILTEFLKNKARSFIFSSSFSASVAASALEALRVLNESPTISEKLKNNVRFFCDALTQRSIPVQTKSAIVPLIIGDEEKAVRVANLLFERNIWVSAIRYPTVEKGTARIRIAINAAHSFSELKYAAEQISNVFLSENLKKQSTIETEAQ